MSFDQAAYDIPCEWGQPGNAAAVARAANRLGRRVGVVPAGERWSDGGLRFALEDFLGAGAIIAHLAGSLSPEASAAANLYRASVQDLESSLRQCGSGRELIAQGFEQDVVLASELNVSEGVPSFFKNTYVQMHIEHVCSDV